jgi:LuxR family maltose regulon positive regulatory protein
VLDDVHLVTNPAILELLTAVVENLPAAATIALGTRAAPALPLMRWRAAGLLGEVGMDDLACDRAEASALLGRRGIALEEADLAMLLRLTESWATGIALASLSAGRQPPAAWLPRVHGDHRQIAEHLIDEVLRAQSDYVQELLLRTSILELLCAAACSAVTGRADAQAVLQRLAHDILFITPLDGRDEWFRYHHLFADFLQQQRAADGSAFRLVTVTHAPSPISPDSGEARFLELCLV